MVDLVAELDAWLASDWELAMESDALIQRARNEILTLRKALDESVSLQSHYAGLLNMHDGGKRLQFATAQDWLGRLRDITQ